MKASAAVFYSTAYGTGTLFWRGDILVAHELPRRNVIAEPHAAAGSNGGATAAQRGLAAMLEAYFLGEEAGIDFGGSRLGMEHLSPFERRVATTLAATGRGDLISYGALAKAAGYPGAARAVGNFMAKNPWPVIIPCHRVIRSDGGIGGFAFGREWKLRLIDIEAGRVSPGRPDRVAKSASS